MLFLKITQPAQRLYFREREIKLFRSVPVPELRHSMSREVDVLPLDSGAQEGLQHPCKTAVAAGVDVVVVGVVVVAAAAAAVIVVVPVDVVVIDLLLDNMSLVGARCWILVDCLPRPRLGQKEVVEAEIGARSADLKVGFANHPALRED